MNEITRIREAEKLAEILIQKAVEDAAAEIEQAKRDAENLIRKRKADAEQESALLHITMIRDSAQEEHTLMAGAKSERNRLKETATKKKPLALSHIRKKIYGASDVFPGPDE